MKSSGGLCALLLASIVASASQGAQDHSAASPPLPTVPAGFSIQVVAAPPLATRPIVAAFDDVGRLYVAESSGSNDPVEKQLELRPHRIVRLEDADGDGKFDRRTVFADRMMFPEGVLFLGGSLYVAAPPSIWKLTDTDGDGVANERIEWFQGKTLTGCANDLHGPYLGPDGWLYWCKGAFAEQVHDVRGRQWTTRAAHIFRCRPDGTDLEPVITGGMDNPVDVVFTPEGERILSATYFVGAGRRAGLVHAVYGGVFGKEHGVLSGHPRTGGLMPALVLMSPAAPCGLERYDSHVFGTEFRDDLFLCQFNLRKVSRHILRPEGSSFASTDSDFVTWENVDFHPTDVLMDADGSLLVVDTGGWYKLCCPTSTLWKPDVLGGIYRIRRIGAPVPADPRGRQIAWPKLTIKQLWSFLTDGRPAVRQQALGEFVRRRDSSELRSFLVAGVQRGATALVSALPPDRTDGSSIERAALLHRAWALSQLETSESRLLVRELLRHPDEHVRHVALTAVGLYRDAEAAAQLVELLAHDTAANRRAAAEALGRIGDRSAVSRLLAAAANADDRILQHSIIYALIELADPAATRPGLAADSPGTLIAALIAIDQMPAGGVDAQQVIPRLSSRQQDVRQAAQWLITRHPEWGRELANWFHRQLVSLPLRSQSRAATVSDLESMLVVFSTDAVIQQLVANTLQRTESSIATRELALRVMTRAELSQPPLAWRTALASAMAEPKLLELAVATARKLPPSTSPDDVLNTALTATADAPELPNQVRVAALAVVLPSLPVTSGPHFELLLGALSADNPVTLRTAAADALAQARLTRPQLSHLCEALASAGPLEINRLLAAFTRTTDERLALELLASLKEASALASLRMDLVRESLRQYGPLVQQGVDELELQVNRDAAAQRRRLQELLPLVAQGDVRRGHAVFHSSKAACSACHRLGHAGGTAGPELTHIGDTRTERDLLESIVYPNLSFVRGYESVLIVTLDGRVINGTIRDETAQEYVLATGPDQEQRVPRDLVEQIQPGTVSIMPAGLDQQLTLQELADLVVFLKNASAQTNSR